MTTVDQAVQWAFFMMFAAFATGLWMAVIFGLWACVAMFLEFMKDMKDEREGR